MVNILQEWSFGLHPEVENLPVLAQNSEWLCRKEITNTEYVLRSFGEISAEISSQIAFLDLF